MAVRVGGDLHLDVACARDLALEEQASVPEGRAGLGRRRAERRRQGRRVLDDPDPAPAAARGRFHDEGVTEALGEADGHGLVVDDAAAPRRHGHAGPFRELLGGDLVAERPHRVARRAEEPHALRDHPVGEHGVLRHESPAGPDRVGARAAERRDHPVVVEIGPDLARQRRQPHRPVGVAHEGGVAIHVGVEDDRPQPGPLASAQRAHGTHAPHGGLAAVHDAETVDRMRHGNLQAKATNRP